MTSASIRLLGFTLGVATSPLGAQRPTDPPIEQALARREVRNALAGVGRADGPAVAFLRELASIESPSGREHRRAAAVARMMRRIGLKDVGVDSAPNVTGRIPGRSGRAVVFVTMLDDLPIVSTFQRQPAHRPRRRGDRVVGAATEIQSTVAAMLTGAAALAASGLRPEHDLIFAGVAREETGLQGMEALYRDLRPRAVAVIEVMGDGQEIHIGAEGAVAWWRVVARGPEGHTMEGGLPNVNQAIARAIDRILSLPHPDRYRHHETAINVGMVRSGEVFNHKPQTGWFSIDVRSRDREIVEEIGREMRGILVRVGEETKIQLELVPDFHSLGGVIPGARDSLLVRAAVAASRYLGLEPEVSDAGCCNMRVAIGGGTMAIGLHGGRGGNRGTAEEWASIPAMMNAARQVVLLGATIGGITRPVSRSRRDRRR